MIAGGYVLLDVADIKRSLRFYIETLGMKLVQKVGEANAVIDAGEGFQLHIAANTQGRRHASPMVRLFVRGPLREAMDVYENRGIQFASIADGQSASFADPDGNVFELAAR